MSLIQNFMTTGINESYTIIGKAAADIADCRGRGFTYDANGDLKLAGSGDTVVGIGILTAGGEGGKVEKGDDVTIQVKGMGRAYLAADVAAGSPLKTNANGNFITAAASDPKIGIATKSGKQDTLGFVLFNRG